MGSSTILIGIWRISPNRKGKALRAPPRRWRSPEPPSGDERSSVRSQAPIHRRTAPPPQPTPSTLVRHRREPLDRARRPRMDDPGPWHHVMNRAVARRPLFQNRHDVRLLRHRRVPPTWTPAPAERTRCRVSLQRSSPPSRGATWPSSMARPQSSSRPSPANQRSRASRPRVSASSLAPRRWWARPDTPSGPPCCSAARPGGAALPGETRGPEPRPGNVEGQVPNKNAPLEYPPGPAGRDPEPVPSPPQSP